MQNDHIYDAIILGAGFGGLGQGAQFVRASIDNFLILEQSADIGGVWRDNTYPGAACDTQTPIYCYSYYLHLTATKMFAEQSELLEYLRAFADAFTLTSRIRLNHQVISAQWNDDDRLWTVRTTNLGEFRCRTFIPAWGQLSNPSIPPLPGLTTFKGTWFHSSRWRHDVDLTGQRVVSIGSAATAVQYVPELAPHVEQLVIFQRSPNYILPRSQRIFTSDERTEFLTETDAFRNLRNSIHRDREEGFNRSRLNTTEAERGIAEARSHLHRQISDPDLRRKLWPDYEFGCKRILRSDDYYPALTRDNVMLVVDPIQEITPDGVRTTGGHEYEADTLIFATGFKSQAFNGDIAISGRGGRTLSDRWTEAPEAFLGISVNGFPNMFLIYGPNTNLNHNSIVSMLEAQHTYIAQCVKHLTESPRCALDVRADVLKAYNEQIQEELEATAYSSECSSWYKNASGKVINNWCGTVDEYQTRTHTVDFTDYVVTT